MKTVSPRRLASLAAAAPAALVFVPPLAAETTLAGQSDALSIWGHCPRLAR